MINFVTSILVKYVPGFERVCSKVNNHIEHLVAVSVIPMMCTCGGIKLRTSPRLLNSVLKKSRLELKIK